MEAEKEMRFIYKCKSIKKDLTHCFETITIPHAKTNITMQRAAFATLSCSHKLYQSDSYK